MSTTTYKFTGSWHEQDPRWTAVDSYTLSHLHPSSDPNHEALNHALQHAHDRGLPDIASYPVLGKLFALQCRAGNVSHALEVGTLGGYTSIWLASLNPHIRVTTIEVNPKHAEVARENLEFAGVSDRVEVIVGPALEVLPKLKAEIDGGERPRFEFAYIDADKLNNLAYFDLVVKMSNPRGTIFVDNVVVRGALVSEDHQDHEMVQGARKVIEGVGKDDRVDAVVMQTVGEKSYDGILMAVVK